MDSEIKDSDLLGTNGKLTLKANTSSNLFFPSFSSVISKFDITPNFAHFVKFIEGHSSIHLNISPSSIWNIDKTGIGIKSAKKVHNWLEANAIYPLAENTNVIQPDKRMKAFEEINATAAEWLTIITAFKQPLDAMLSKYPLVNIPLDFIESRINNDYNCLIFLKNELNIHNFQELKSKQVSSKKIFLIQHDFLRKNSNIPDDHINAITNASTTQGPLRIEKNLALAFLHLRYDFYLELISSIEVGIHLFFRKNMLLNNIPSMQRSLGKAIAYYSHNQEGKESSSPESCFSGFLHVLKDELPAGSNCKSANKTDGWRTLSSFININSAKDSTPSETLADRKYRQLNHWRTSGHKPKHKPSSDALKAFTKNYLDHIGRQGDRLIEIYFRLMRMLDNLELEVLNETNDQKATKVDIKTVLSRYPIYYEKNLNAQLQE